MTQEEKLFNRYTEKLEILHTSYNREPIAPFIGVNLREGPAPVFDDWFSAWQSDTIQFRSDQAPIFEELLDFSAIVSYMSLSYRRNAFFLPFVFLLRFRESSQSKLKKICFHIYQEVSSQEFKLKLKSFLYYRQINDLLTERKFLLEYLPTMSLSRNFQVFYYSLVDIYFDYEIKPLNFQEISQLLSSTESSIMMYFSRRKAKEKFFDIYKKNLFETYLSIDFEKIGLERYCGILIFNSEVRNLSRFITKFLAQIPFFSTFHGSNLESRFDVFIPLDVKSAVISYFEHLKALQLITYYELQRHIELKSVIQFDPKISNLSRIDGYWPFNSSKWKFKRIRKYTLSDINLNQFVYSSTNKEILTTQFRLTPLHMYISLNRTKLFELLFHFKSPSAFFRFVQQNIESFNQSTFLLINARKADLIGEDSSVSNFFRKKHNYSHSAIQKTVIELFKHQILGEDKQLQIMDQTLRFMNQMIAYIDSTERIPILESSLMGLRKHTFHTIRLKKRFRYVIAFPVKFWPIFSNILFEIPQCYIHFQSRRIRYFNLEDLVYFYDYSKNKWIFSKFSLQNYCTRIDQAVKEYLPTSSSSLSSFQDFSIKSISHDPKKLFNHFSRCIVETQRHLLITNILLISQPNYLQFLSILFHSQFLSKPAVKVFLQAHFSLTPKQITSLIETLNFSTVSLPQFRKMIRGVVIIRGLVFPTRLQDLLIDPLFSGLFCHGLKRIWTTSCEWDGLVILEYELPKEIIRNPKSNLNFLLTKINRQHGTKFQFQEITHEVRFYSEMIVHPFSLKQDGFSHIKVNENDKSITNPNHVKYDLTNAFGHSDSISPTSIPQYCDHLWHDQFWQYLGYPVELLVMVKIPERLHIPIMNLYLQMPIGTFYTIKNEEKDTEHMLIGFIRAEKNIDLLLNSLDHILANLKIESFLSIMTNFEMSFPKILLKLLRQTQTHHFLQTNTGDLLEIPLYIKDRYFSLSERVLLYTLLKGALSESSSSLTPRRWRIFCDKLAEIENLCHTREKVERLITDTL